MEKKKEKRKKKKRQNQRKKKKKKNRIDILNNDELDKNIKIYFDITKCIKYCDVNDGHGLKITHINTKNKYGKKLCKKAQITNDIEWIISKIDKKKISNTTKTSLIVSYLRYRQKKNGKCKLNIIYHQKKSSKQPLRKRIDYELDDVSDLFMFGYFRIDGCLNDYYYDINPFCQMIIKYCDIATNIDQFNWNAVMTINDISSVIIIMQCDWMNGIMLLNLMNLKYDTKMDKLFNLIFVGIRNYKNGSVNICSFGEINCMDLQNLYDLSIQKNNYCPSTELKWQQTSKNCFLCIYEEKSIERFGTVFGVIDTGYRKYLAINTKKFVFSCNTKNYCHNVCSFVDDNLVYQII